MARDSRLRVGGWVPDGDTAGGAGVPPEDRAYRTDDMDDPDATIPVPRLIDLGDEPGFGPTGGDLQTGEMPRYRGRRRHRRREPRGHLLAAAAVVAAVVVGTATLVQLASSDPVTLGPPPAPESSEVVTSPSAIDGRLGEAPTPTPVTSSSPGAGGPSSSPGPDPTAPGSTAPPPGDPGSGGSYEAEHASAQRGAATESMGAASGGQVVRLNPNASLQFSGVVADREGTYQLTVYYAGTSYRTARLSVNGGSSATVEFPALEAGTVGTVTLGVHLPDGENTITIGQPNEPGLLVDRILVTD